MEQDEIANNNSAHSSKKTILILEWFGDFRDFQQSFMVNTWYLRVFLLIFWVFCPLRITREFNQQEWGANKSGQHPEIIRWGSTSCSKTEEPGWARLNCAVEKKTTIHTHAHKHACIISCRFTLWLFHGLRTGKSPILRTVNHYFYHRFLWAIYTTSRPVCSPRTGPIDGAVLIWVWIWPHL